MIRKNKLGGITFASSLAILGMVSILAFNSSSTINAAGAFGSGSDYTVVLNSDNKITNSETHKDITTSSGSWQIGFDYTNCSVNASGHATIADGGKIVNTVQITSIDYMQFVFSGSGHLQFRTSYDGATWSGYSNAISTEVYNLPSMPYYVELSADGGSVNLTSATYQYTCVDNPAAHGHEVETETVFQLVEDEKDIIVGDVYTFATVNNGEGFVCTNTTTANYYLAAASITVSDNEFDYVSGYGFLLSGTKGAYKFTKEGGDSTPLYDGKTYQSLYYLSDSDETNTWNINISGNQIYSNNTTDANPHYIVYNSSKNNWNSYKFGSGTATYLYHKVEKSGTEYDTPSDIIGLQVSDVNANNYTTESVYSSDNGLVVKGIKQDGTQVTLTSTQYTYAVSKTQGGSAIDKTAAFPEAGTYWVRIQYSSLLPVDISIVVGTPAAVVTGISVSMTTSTYTTADKVVFTNNLKANLTFSDSSVISNVAYADFGSYGLTASLLNPNGVAHNLNEILGTAGNWSVKVYKTDNVSVFGTCSVTVTAVPVQNITLDKASASLEVGDQLKLVATITPATATTQSVAWSSNAAGVASVDSTGLVTAISAGSARITVTTTDGGFTASCDITVTTPVVPTGFEKITSESDIQAGMKVVIGNADKGVVAGDISSSVMGSVDSTFSGTTCEPGSDAVILTVGGTSGAWTLENDSGNLLGATAAKKLAWDSGTTTWTISISSGSATIQSTTSTYGRFLYNVGSPRFTTYTSATSTTMLLPELYGTSGQPVYATNVTLPASQTAYVGNTLNLSATVSPSNYNQGIVWASSNTSKATVDDNGVVTALATGSVSITATVKTGESTTQVATCNLTITTVSVTGVTLNENTHTVSIGSDFQLTATVAPSNASNKTVSWSSSNTSKATVDSTGKVTGVATGSATITCTTQDGNKTASCTVTVTEVQMDKWTIMFYICGADLESGSGLATGDLTEIKNAGNKPSNVNVIVEAGGASSWSSTYSSVINKGYLNRFHLNESKAYVKDAQITKANMGLTSTFQSFMEWGLTEYPAEHTMVVFWNHGGAMMGCCYDENFNDDSLTNDETVNALSGAFTKVGRTSKLDVVGYDCCLMQVDSIAEFNSQYFNYMLASEESESGNGWDYDATNGWVKEIFSNPSTATPSSFLTKCCDTFIAEQGSKSDQTLSWLNLTNMPAYKTAMENLASYLKNSVLTSSNKTTFINLVKGCKSYGEDDYSDDYLDYCIFDVKDVLNKLGNNSTFSSAASYINSAKTAFDNLVGYDKHGTAAGNSNGLAMWCGIDYCSYYIQQGYYCSSTTNFSNWLSLWQTYGKNN